MYKFTNGIIVYDKETKNAYIKAGMRLVEEKKVEDKKETNILDDIKGNEEIGSSTEETQPSDRKGRK